MQAKTYLTFVKLGRADVNTIAKTADMARQNVYRVMPELQKMGLAEKIIAKPTVYVATPINEGLSILLLNRKKEYSELQNKTSSIINNFKKYDNKILAPEECTQFKITSEPTLFLKIHKNLTQKAQHSIDAIVPLIITPSKLTEVISFLEEETKRDLKTRFITQKAEKNFAIQELLSLEKKGLCEIKYLNTSIPLGLHIFDKKQITLSISEREGLPCLWSNNPNLIRLATSYFEEMWRKAKPSVL